MTGKLRNIIIIAMYICIPYSDLYSQIAIRADDFRGQVGYNSELKVEISGLTNGIHEIEFYLYSDNITLFKPMDIISASGNSIVESFVSDNISDKGYLIRSTIEANDDVQFSILGQTLAGNDTVAEFILGDIIINDQQFDDVQCTMNAWEIAGALPYVKFSKVEGPYPNPVSPGGYITWNILTDKDAKMEVVITDLKFKIFKREFIDVNKGGYTYGIRLPEIISPGIFLVTFKTGSGTHNSVFMVAR